MKLILMNIETGRLTTTPSSDDRPLLPLALMFPSRAADQVSPAQPFSISPLKLTH